MKEFFSVVLFKNLFTRFCVHDCEEVDDFNIMEKIEVCLYEYKLKPSDGIELFRGEDDFESFDFFGKYRIDDLGWDNFKGRREDDRSAYCYESPDGQVLIIFLHEIDDDGNETVTVQDKTCSWFSSFL